jgi:hypothetical protein
MHKKHQVTVKKRIKKTTPIKTAKSPENTSMQDGKQSESTKRKTTPYDKLANSCKKKSRMDSQETHAYKTPIKAAQSPANSSVQDGKQSGSIIRQATPYDKLANSCRRKSHIDP